MVQIFSRGCANKTPFRLSWLLAVGILLLEGAAYRYQAIRMKVVVREPVKLPLPLKTLPLAINGWVGQDMPVPEFVQQTAGNDDFVNRIYVNKLTNQWAGVYVAYSCRPRTMLGHRPTACYVASGWVHDGSEQSQMVTSGGRTIPYLIHRFHQPNFARDEIVVLNFYVLNGQFSCEENSFSGVGWRTPNIAGDPARYVAQVQVSSVLENSVLAATKDVAESILEILPDKNGKVGAAERTSCSAVSCDKQNSP